jgi:uncharacterized protein YbbC (DUF1343 family)
MIHQPNQLIYRKFTHLFLFIGILLFTQPILAQKVETGIDVLQKTNFSALQGKTIGILTNPTGVNKNLELTIHPLHTANTIDLKKPLLLNHTKQVFV